MIKLKLVTEIHEPQDDDEAILVGSEIEALEVEDQEELESLLKEFEHASCSPLHEKENFENVWVCTDPDEDFRTGEVTIKSLHLVRQQREEIKAIWKEALLNQFQTK